MPSKSTLARIEANTMRIKRLGLRPMCFHVPDKLYKAFGIKIQRDGITRRAFATAAIELYVQGGFKVEKEKDKADEK